jgi:DNA repair protein RecO (recombination protein O)
MQIKTDGLIIREINVGEDDRIVKILTRDNGVIQASAKGVRKFKSHCSAAVRLLCFSHFTLFRGREKYIINDAEPIQLFIGVHKDLEKLALSQYFAELCGVLAPEEENAEFFLRLTLNALHMIETNKHPLPLIKAAFEMRILSLAGYMPDLVACFSCGEYEADIMYLLPVSGNLCCKNCLQSDVAALPLSRGALAALRHTVFADFERIFSFTLTDSAMRELEQASERFLLCRLERSFNTLEFYRQLKIDS